MGVNDIVHCMTINGNIAIQQKQPADSKPAWFLQKKKRKRRGGKNEEVFP